MNCLGVEFVVFSPDFGHIATQDLKDKEHLQVWFTWKYSLFCGHRWQEEIRSSIIFLFIFTFCQNLNLVIALLTMLVLLAML